MKDKKRAKLPRGLRWHSESRFIWFTWYDNEGRQHKKSTETSDPEKALLFKLRFLERQEERNADQVESPDLTQSSLASAAELYFDWKLANNSAETVSRERRMFNNVLKFFGPQVPVNQIRLPHIRSYQKQRRQQISPSMKQPVTARTVNYEMQLLKGVLRYADCWSDTLAARYQPLREMKSRAGKTASTDQMIKIIKTAEQNEYWQVAMWCGAVGAGTGCRRGEIRKLQLKDICLAEGKIRIVREVAKTRKQREPRLMAIAEWGLRQLLTRAHALGATDPEHYLLPLNTARSRYAARRVTGEWDVTKPMRSWVKSWRKLMAACGMKGFRFHDLRHTFRTQGAEAGVPLEVMMAQLGHMDRQTSLDYVHIQQHALERAKQLIEAEQAEILAATRIPSTAESSRSCQKTPAVRPQSTLPASPARPDAQSESREAAQKIQLAEASTSLNSGSRSTEAERSVIVTPSPF